MCELMSCSFDYIPCGISRAVADSIGYQAPT